MKQWISKLRTQKARTRLKQTERTSVAEDRPSWSSQMAGVLVGFLAWFLAYILLETGRPFPADLGGWMAYAGDGVFLLVGLIACSAALYVTSPAVLRHQAKLLLLLLLLALLTLIPARALLYMADGFPMSMVLLLMPLALGPLLATILIGSGAGLALGLWTTYVAAIFSDRSFTVIAIGLVTTGIAACMGRDVRKRSRVFKIGLMIGLTNIYVVVALTAVSQGLPYKLLFGEAAACLVNGLLTAVIVLLILPLLEAVFGITTDITLLELSDLGHPLLQRLAMEAPGTYQHSLVVANLAQAAADDIHADSLLARVCSYFHDIGKLTKPELFSENIRAGESPHDGLTPNMSALLITAHVKEGISFAMLSKLPRLIIDVIQQHHGTGLVTYFHHKATEELRQQNGTQAAGYSTINESDFRYGGPKPLTREAAIILLADSVEAASRSLAKPTPNHIRNLVDEIVEGKVQDGQLDLCDISLAELKQVKESFIFTLTNMLHSRIPYPKNENRNKQPPEG